MNTIMVISLSGLLNDTDTYSIRALTKVDFIAKFNPLPVIWLKIMLQYCACVLNTTLCKPFVDPSFMICSAFVMAHSPYYTLYCATTAI